MADTGLAEVEAARRLEARGQPPRRRSSRSYTSIVRANTVTIHNGILWSFGGLTIAFGSWRAATRARDRPQRLAASRRRLQAAVPDDVQALGLVVLAERLRPNAAETVAFFIAQGVELKVLSGDALRPNAAETVAFFIAQGVGLKVLSGDAPATVGAIARDAGVPGSAAALDGDALPTEPAGLREAVLSAPAVGRISPEGKRAVVAALAGAGHFVAMVGDGVNDVASLKEARLAIAQGSGAQMSRSVADLVGWATTSVSCRKWSPRGVRSCATSNGWPGCSQPRACSRP